MGEIYLLCVIEIFCCIIIAPKEMRERESLICENVADRLCVFARNLHYNSWAPNLDNILGVSTSNPSTSIFNQSIFSCSTIF